MNAAQGVNNQLAITNLPSATQMISTEEVSQKMDKAIDANEKPLVQIARDSNGYTVTLDLQKTAGQGTFTARVDAGLAEAVLTAQAGARDGRISVEDVTKYIKPALEDGVKGNKYADSEKPIIHVLLSAMDGRVRAELGGDRVNWGGDAAKKAFVNIVRSAIAHDAAVARWAERSVSGAKEA